MSWLEHYLESLSPEDRAEFHAVAAKAPKPTEPLTARLALRFRRNRGQQPKNTRKSA